MSRKAALWVAVLVVIACSKSEPPREARVSTPAGDPLSDQALSALRYTTTQSPGGTRIDTTQGATEPNGAQHTSIVLIARGDLSGDNKPEAVVVLFSDSGESGKFLDLVPVFADASGARPGRPTFLGDRVRPDSLWVSGGQAYLRIVTHGPSDPACCPGQPEEHRYRLLGDSLRLEERKALPTPDTTGTD
ncbi:MAG TPA: hypothetical protein VIF83_10715 [Gemmatimonadaceae bacterium]|jgi:hypothetical protein